MFSKLGKSSTEEVGYEITNEIEPEFEKKQSTLRNFGAVFTGGCAFVSDGYQQGCITMINALLASHYKAYDGAWKTRVSNAALVSNIIGQVLVGVFVDRIGRKPAFSLSTAFIILGSILCACASGTSVQGLLWMLTISRGIAGAGVGAEYPTSASSAIEAASERLGKKKRLVPFILSTNVPIGFGLPFATIVFLIFFSIWGEDHPNGIWRSCFAFGAILPLAIYYFRMKMDHAEVYKKNAIQSKVPYILMVKKLWKEIIGVSLMWFMMDFCIYPNNIFSASVLQVAVPHASIKETAEWQLFLGSFAFFGAIIGILLFRYLERKQMIIIGFVLYGIISIVVGAAYDHLVKIPALFVILYALLNIVMYAGPADFQSVVASECYPTAVRGTLYGFAAAVGKAGAAVGVEAFTPIQTNLGKKYTFYVSGAASILGAILVLFLVPDTSKVDFEELDQEFNSYLLANGWEGNIGEKEDKRHIKAIDINQG
ncbi:hypothetical protein KL905_004266 [Ogataea polymorpha]|uniref:uncharacterized protein n=1 Tax=Ogataea polymorpha TaxID=460523 RepID=UPI0007F3D842|nr:uncharacterized protein OGAPODRAFT_76364 [Ogataea polymorpha]KAG7878394.1 hypothetical protein KL937_003636 [Ogataea polymorpha]KAG7887660.1 hypothetical protein KL936_004357 [Ogataea polymorpha]KAG7899095.1 hypothetical protein KL935_004103 [Ogataea polymorpha]KAG7907212.1 hypothetical protein KL906_003899 [Ogataea polymorpha]KAG7918187.1 hypothetical protein KL905_004266 [Ogataea polymorpha]